MPITADTVAQYLRELRAIRDTGSATAETSFYPPIEHLFNAIGQTLTPPVLFSTQLKSQRAGMPDGGFFPQRAKSRKSNTQANLTNPERGAVEIKPPGTSLDDLAASAQTAKYLQQYGIVLITNLHQFRLLGLDAAGNVRNLEPPYVLAASAGDLWTAPLSVFARHAQTLPDFLSRVMLYRAPLVQPKDVAWLLASYAREARARAEDHPLASFQTVRAALEESLGIQFHGEKGERFFRSTLVQTLFYGIFSAWILWKGSQEGKARNARFDWRTSAYYLKVPVLQQLFNQVAAPGGLNATQLTEILNLAGEALNRVEAGFFEAFRQEDAVAYFYEPFLQAFDPVLRKEFGVWYTPREIVEYMVERVDHLLRTELHLPLGLAAAEVCILDPCCGTGAYLTAVLHRIHRTLLEQAGDDTALVPGDLRKATLTRVFGFEIMPAPFVIAHLQLASLLESAGAPLREAGPGRPFADRARVYLTNALTGWVPEPHKDVLFEEFRREREAAEGIKQSPSILVVLGNPPYDGYADIATLPEERALSDAYRYPIPGLPAPQGQGLNELYIRFFRIAERRIVGDNQVRGNGDSRGIVCYITNYSWLDGLSHSTMRYRYLQTFDQIYIDNLHVDRKISEYAPDGRTSETVFAVKGSGAGIKVGTAISTLVRTGKPLDGVSLSFRDFDNARASERRSALLLCVFTGKPNYETLTPNRVLGLPYKPRSVATSYTAWPRLPELFPVSYPGVKTSRDSLLVDIDKTRLEARIKSFLDVSISETSFSSSYPNVEQNVRPEIRRFLQERVVRAYSGKLTPELERELQSYSFRNWQILPYVYRPFDVRYVYWEPAPGLLDRNREEALPDIFPGNLFVEARQRESDESFCRGSVVGSLADNFGAGLSTFFPIVFLAASNIGLSKREIKAKQWHYIAAPNLSEESYDFINELAADALEQYGNHHASEIKPTSRDEVFNHPYSYLFFHALAVMHTPAYRSENAGALLSDWPRIPLPSTLDLLSTSAELGRELADLLDAESSLGFTTEWSFLSRLQSAKDAPDEDKLKITAGWGSRGQGSTVMPGRGSTTTRPWTPEEAKKLETLATLQDLTLENAMTLLGETCVDVRLNPKAEWLAVPTNVWRYTLGGYQVLKKWLSYREHNLLGRPLHEDESRYFAQVVRRITAILLLGPALDRSYAAILPTATGLPQPAEVQIRCNQTVPKSGF